MTGLVAWVLSKVYTGKTADALGAVKGANCTLPSNTIRHDDERKRTRLRFLWTGDSGTSEFTDVYVPDGKDGKTPTQEDIKDGVDAYFEENPLEQDYTTSRPVAIDVGGIKAGTTFDKTPIKEVFDKLFSPPYTKPNVRASVDCSTLNDPTKISLPSIRITGTVTKGTEDIAYIKFYVNDVPVNTINNPISLSQSYNKTFSTPVNETTKIKVEVADKETGSVVSSSLSVKFIPGCRYGVLADDVEINPTTVGTLTYSLKDSKGGTFQFTTPYGRFVYAYPKEFGQISSAKDLVNNFNYTESVKTIEMTINSYDYYVTYLEDSAGFEDVAVTFA